MKLYKLILKLKHVTKGCLQSENIDDSDRGIRRAEPLSRRVIGRVQFEFWLMTPAIQDLAGAKLSNLPGYYI